MLSEVAAAPPPTAPEQRDGRLRLRVLSAQLLQAEARSGPAAAKLRLLLAEHPAYVPALLGLAQVERERGRWRIADALLQRVLGVDPVNEDARRTRAELRGTHGGHLQLQTEWLQIDGGQRERRSRVSADDLIAGGVRLGTIVEQNQMALAGRRYTRERAELFLQSELESGLELRTSGFATRGALGGGLRIGHADGPRRTFMQADIRRPYWEAVEAVVGRNTRDRVEVHHDDQLGRRLSLGLTGAVNRYGRGGTTGEARSLALDGNVGFSLLRGSPTLVARYGVDLESIHLRRPDALPLVSREVHAGSATVQQRLGRALVAEATAGYAWDRRGGAGPFGSGRITYDGPGRLGLQLWFERRLHTLSTDQRVTRAGANIVVKLD